VNTPATEALEARKTAAGMGDTIRSGLSHAWKTDPANTLMAGATAAGALSSVAAPVIANMTAPGAPSRGHNQTGGMMPMPAN
jgi:hypothetical protein